MIHRRLAGAFAALAVMAGVLLAVAAPAQATEVHYPAGGWWVQDTTIGADVDWVDCDPAPTRVDAAASAIVDDTTVDLAGTGVAAPPHYGTSVEATDLGLSVAAGDVISVSYALLDGASPAGASVRLFYYDHAGADTDCTAPTAFVAAPDDGSTSGTLSITVGADATIGTLGLAYDSSNGGTGGTVRFSGLSVAGVSVLFVAPPEPCEWDESLGADDEACQSPATATPPPASGSPAPGSGGSALPNTSGVPVLGIISAGFALLAIGGGIYWLATRKRNTSTSG